MDKKLTVREYSDTDKVELISMVMALYHEDTYGEPMSHEKIEKTISELKLHHDKGVIYIFSVEGTRVGYAILINFWSNEHGGNIIFIDEIYIKPQWRSQGISSAFIAFVCDLDKHTKALQVEVTPTNEKSLEFFSKNGFKMDENRFLLKLL
jgi:GNAT superfamily N-acetyltransferase